MTFAFPRPHFTNPYSWPDQQPNVNTSLLPFPPHKKHPTFCWSHVLCRFIANIRTSSSTYKNHLYFCNLRYTQKLESTCFEASAFRQSILHLMSGFVAYMESDSRSIEKDGTLVGERRNHVARSVELYLDDSSSTSFSNYSEEKSLISDLRFFIAWTIFGACLAMNS